MTGIVMLQRLAELWLARRNGRWIREQGGYEVGRSHYKWIVVLHAGFFVGMAAEVAAGGRWHEPIWLPALAVFAAAQLLRFWSLASLGRYWSTRVYVVPGHPLVKRGPYRWLRHPNYLAVAAELASLPLIFRASLTALTVSITNLAVLTLRVRVEEEALRGRENRP